MKSPTLAVKPDAPSSPIPITFVELLDWAKALAPRLLDQHPALAEQHVQRWLGGKTDYLKA